MSSETQDDKKRADYFAFTVSELAIEIHDSLTGADSLLNSADDFQSKADDLYAGAEDLKTRARECMEELVQLLGSRDNAAQFAKVWSRFKDQIFDDNTD